jgi:hypothetical protein
LTDGVAEVVAAVLPDGQWPTGALATNALTNDSF